MSAILDALASVPVASGKASIARTELVRPAMCGPNALLAGRIGDWTWDAVSALCNINVLRAADAEGNPTYLSFYYYRIRGSTRFHLYSPRFGDRLDINSAVFGVTPESVHTVHAITPNDGRRGHVANVHPIRWDEIERNDPPAMYVENFNRWIVRSRPDSNADLVSASPLGFRHEHLPQLPAACSPRGACKRARSDLTFLDLDADELHDWGTRVVSPYRIDPTRDLNGVGLVYFATYFTILDRALWQQWRGMGRSQQSFLDRVVLDQRICFVGNADVDSRVDATVRHLTADTADEHFDIVLRCDRRTLAICTLTLAGLRG